MVDAAPQIAEARRRLLVGDFGWGGERVVQAYRGGKGVMEETGQRKTWMLWGQEKGEQGLPVRVVSAHAFLICILCAESCVVRAEREICVYVCVSFLPIRCLWIYPKYRHFEACFR